MKYTLTAFVLLTLTPAAMADLTWVAPAWQNVIYNSHTPPDGIFHSSGVAGIWSGYGTIGLFNNNSTQIGGVLIDSQDGGGVRLTLSNTVSTFGQYTLPGLTRNPLVDLLIYRYTPSPTPPAVLDPTPFPAPGVQPLAVIGVDPGSPPVDVTLPPNNCGQPQAWYLMLDGNGTQNGETDASLGVEPLVAPEPSTFWIGVSGGLGLILVAARKRYLKAR
jgi:hypothetical protein